MRVPSLQWRDHDARGRAARSRAHDRKVNALPFILWCLAILVDGVTRDPRSVVDSIPNATLGVQYASPTGDDANDGLSWAAAKLTILGAYDALPSLGGTIYIANNTTMGGSVAGQGFWIIGTLDPSYNAPPAGWRHQKGIIHLVGVGGNNDLPAFKPASYVLGVDDSTAGMWFAGCTSGTILIENLSMKYPRQAVRIGIGSNGVDRTVAFCANLTFRGCTFAVNGIGGPVVDMGYSFWVWFEGCSFTVNSSAALTSAARAAINMDASGGNSPNLIYIRDCLLRQGGVRYTTGGTSWSLEVKDCTFEGDGVHAQPAIVRIINPNSSGKAVIWNIEQADVGAGSENAVVIEGANAADNAPNDVSESILIVGATSVTGPATVLQTYPATWSTVTKSPLASGQYGLMNGHLVGRHDAARRLFAPTLVRFANISETNPASWSGGGGAAVVTPGQADPAGGTLAARLTSGAGTASTNLHDAANANVNAGDYVIAGFWCRAPSGFYSPNIGTVLRNGTTVFTLHAAYKGSGEWQWVSGWGKLPNTEVASIDLRAFCDATHPTDVYGPVMSIISGASISDNEAAELALHMASVPNTAPAGRAATMPGVPLWSDTAGEFPKLNGSKSGANVTQPTLLAAFPNSGDHGVYKDTGGGAYYYCWNDGGTVRKVALT